MASESGVESNSVTEKLAESPFSFDFFQAVRRLECEHPELPRVGESDRAGDEPVRFGQEVSLKFAPSTISRFVPGEEGRLPHMFVHFLGLLGPNGPLPLHLTEYAQAREQNYRDPALARFLDIFNHRMVSFFYRAWACNRLAVHRDREEGDRFAAYVGSLFGIGMDSFRDRDSVPDAAKLHYSGRLVCQTRNAEGLQAVVRDFFGIEAEVEQFVGHWMDLPSDCCCRLGESPETGALGSTLIVGSRIWECQQKFRIKMGPMKLDDYERMLPQGDSFRRLRDWVRNYVGDEFLWDVQLILEAEEVPAVQLGKGGRLGWNTWMKSRPSEKDAEDLILNPFTAQAL